MKLSDVLTCIGKPFPYFPSIAIMLGSVKACVLLCALVWRDRDREGNEFLKTQEMIMTETGLSKKEIRTARQQLTKLGILKTHYRRLEHITSFSINLEALDALYSTREACAQKAHGEEPQAGSERATGMGRKGTGHGPKGDFDHLVDENKKENKEIKQNGLPDWIPVEAWKGFVEMRKKIRRPLTPRAVVLAIRTLEKLKEGGNDPGAVLDQSVLRGWQGLFEVRSIMSSGESEEESKPAF